MARQAITLLHGGLYEPVGAARFWHDPGVVEQLQGRGVDAFAPDRLTHPMSWAHDAQHIASHVASRAETPVPVIAGSNGCNTAVRLAIEHPELVGRLVLCWPVTAGQQDLDGRLRPLIAGVSGDHAADELLNGETLRGVSDDELAELVLPVAVMASAPENKVHQHTTVERMLDIIPGSVRLTSCPETMAAHFSAGDFVDAIVGYAVGDRDPR